MPSLPLPWDDRPALGAHAAVIDHLRHAVTDDDRWRWLEVGCSLARGAGDELSDIDAGVGYEGGTEVGDLHAAGTALVEAGGAILDVLVHVMPAWPDDTRRFAVEYGDGVQLDLVLMPSERRPGLAEGSVAVVDKDDRLARPWRPGVADPPTPELAREWAMLGWWAISDVAKYLRRSSLHEAVERIAEARQQALRLHAAGEGVPYPTFGLVSLLDFPPYELPVTLDRTYCTPDDPAGVAAAAEATADLLQHASAAAAAALNATLDTAWSGSARARLGSAVLGL
jgi:hypothetical protein